MRHLNKAYRQKGFTLIEIMTAVSILAIILTILAPRISESIKEAIEKQCAANRVLLEEASKRFMFDKGILNPSIQELVNANYIDRYPKCTSNGVYIWLNSATAQNPYRDIGCSIHGWTIFGSISGDLEYYNDFVNTMAGLSTIRGGWQIADGKLVPTSTAYNRLVLSGAAGVNPGSNFQISVNAVFGSGGAANNDYGIFYDSQWRPNQTNPDSGYYFRFNSQNNRFELIEYGGNSPTRRVNFPPGFIEFNTSHNITITVVNNTHTIKVDGNTIMSFYDDSFSSGLIGLGTRGNKTSFDDINVTKIE